MSPSDDGFAFAVIALASAANRRCTLSDQPHLTKPNPANVAERCSLLRGGVETLSAVHAVLYGLRLQVEENDR